MHSFTSYFHFFSDATALFSALTSPPGVTQISTGVIRQYPSARHHQPSRRSSHTHTHTRIHRIKLALKLRTVLSLLVVHRTLPHGTNRTEDCGEKGNEVGKHDTSDKVSLKFKLTDRTLGRVCTWRSRFFKKLFVCARARTVDVCLTLCLCWWDVQTNTEGKHSSVMSVKHYIYRLKLGLRGRKC